MNISKVTKNVVHDDVESVCDPQLNLDRGCKKKHYKTRFVSNSNVFPAEVEAAMAGKGKKRIVETSSQNKVKSRIFSPTVRSCDKVKMCVNNHWKSVDNNIVYESETYSKTDTVDKHISGDAKVPGSVIQQV